VQLATHESVHVEYSQVSLIPAFSAMLSSLDQVRKESSQRVYRVTESSVPVRIVWNYEPYSLPDVAIDLR
jgi:hypothetical protein